MRLKKKYEELEKRVAELERALSKKQVSERVEQEDRQLDIIKEYLLGKRE